MKRRKSREIVKPPPPPYPPFSDLPDDTNSQYQVLMDLFIAFDLFHDSSGEPPAFVCRTTNKHLQN